MIRKFFENSKCEDLLEYFIEMEDEFGANITYLSNFEGEIQLIINFEVTGKDSHYLVEIDGVLKKLWERVQFIRNIGEFNTSENHRGNWGVVSFIIPFENTYDIGEIAIGDREASDFSKFMEKLRETEFSKWAINSSVVERISCHFIF